MKIEFDTDNLKELQAVYQLIKGFLGENPTKSVNYERFFNTSTSNIKQIFLDWADNPNLETPQDLKTVAKFLNIEYRKLHAAMGVMGRWDVSVVKKISGKPGMYYLDPDFILFIKAKLGDS